MTTANRRVGVILLVCLLMGLTFGRSPAVLIPLVAICVVAIFWRAWLAWRKQGEHGGVMSEPKQQISVFINPMKLFEWEKEPIGDLPPDPTPERLFQFLCPIGVNSKAAALKARYQEISTKDQDLVFSIQEPGMVENLSGPLRQAKTSYVLGNYLGAIALCGIVAEKVAILIHAINTPEEGDRDDFERLGQAQRVEQLKDRKLLGAESIQDFGQIRAARKRYLHYWTAINDERTARDAVNAYGAATRLVLACMGVGFASGALTLKPALAAYLKDRGIIRERAEGKENDR